VSLYVLLPIATGVHTTKPAETLEKKFGTVAFIANLFSRFGTFIIVQPASRIPASHRSSYNAANTATCCPEGPNLCRCPNLVQCFREGPRNRLLWFQGPSLPPAAIESNPCDHQITRSPDSFPCLRGRFVFNLRLSAQSAAKRSFFFPISRFFRVASRFNY
jgi:hypothetical protein